MTATRLSLYQGAAQVLGERKPVSLTENVPVRKELDGVWERGGLRTCLQTYLWNFATRSAEMSYSPSITPSHGYRYAFQKPDDFVRLVQICRDEYYKSPLNEYTDETSHWFADIDPIYVRYVSDDEDFGGDLSKWPENFTRFVEHYFAHAICTRITGSGRSKAEIQADLTAAKATARATDAAEEPTTFAPRGSWSQSRSGNLGRYRI